MERTSLTGKRRAPARAPGSGFAIVAAGALAALSAGCGGSSSTPQARTQAPAYGQPYGNPPYANPQSPNPPYANPQYQSPPYQNPPYANPQSPNPPYQNPTYPAPPPSNPPYAQVPAPAPAPQVPPTAQIPTRPLLAPLVGTVAMRAEVAQVLAELIANLAAIYKPKVLGIPLQFEGDPSEINAYAGCDEHGKSFMAGTEGILLAMHALAETRATDEMFGTKTYQAYLAAVVPGLTREGKATPALPLTIIPPAQAIDPRRLSRAHELFDEIAAFTFGHELAHHYLGHTGCATGENVFTAGLARLGNITTNVVPVFNQPNEVAADNFGVVDVLDTGRARRPNYAWTSEGGLLLLDFFGRLRPSGSGAAVSLSKYFSSHPDPGFRASVVTAMARNWASRNP